MIYYRRGLQVTLVQADLEFKTLEELVKQLPCVPELDIAAKEEHVSNVERNIWFLKESFGSYAILFHFDRFQESLLFKWCRYAR